MTAKEILEDFNVWCLCDSRECQKSVNYKQSLALLQAEMLKVIGEDENIHAKDPSGIRPWLMDVPALTRNALRAEQRQRLREFIGTDNG